MKWFDKIKELTTKKDNSAELKKGAIKDILIQTEAEVLPDFDFLSYNKKCYTFQRLRKSNELTVYETLHIIFNLKDRNFACSIASRLNPEYIHVNSYNNGIINPHKDLKVLKNSSGALNIQDAFYFHNGQIETTTKMVREIFQDYKNFGLPFLDKHFERIKSNELLKVGFTFIDNLIVDKETLKKEIEKELNNNRQLLSNIKHPLYLDLKEQLQNTVGQSKEERQLISKTTLEFLEIYWMR